MGTSTEIDTGVVVPEPENICYVNTKTLTSTSQGPGERLRFENSFW